MKFNSFLLIISSVLLSASAPKKNIAPVDFNILIVRASVTNNLLNGQIFLDGKLLGNCYENDSLKIPAGKFSGKMRYHSNNNFVQDGLGSLSHEGDFLVEVSVPGRTNILLHSGNRPYHSTGCILLGPANKSPDGSVSITKDHPLYKLRLAFYGTEFPNSCPDKTISVEIK